MSTLTYTNTLIADTPEDVSKVQTNFVDVRTVLNGNLDGTNFTTAAKDMIALSDSGVVRRGKSVIAGSEAIAGTSFAALTTPDRVASIVVPSGGVLWVSYWAILTKTVGGVAETASIGLFLGSNQVKSRFGVAPASGVSSGRMELVGFGVPATTGHSLGAYVLVHSDTTDTGLNYLASSNVGPADNTAAGHPVGAFVPITVGPGNYVVDFMARADTGGPYYFVGSMFTKTEAF